MLIGLSVSACVGDIARGVVREESVAYIIGATALKDEEAMLDACQRYAGTYWADCPVRATEVMMRLWIQGKILQPRLQGGPSLLISRGYWLNCGQPTYAHHMLGAFGDDQLPEWGGYYPAPEENES